MKLRHAIQQEILQYLLFHPKSRFGEMKPAAMDNSRFTFHLDQLLKEQWIEKGQDGHYSLSALGKDEANRFDDGSLSPRKQSKVSVVFCCKDTITEKLLFYQRTKEPYFGAMGFPTGKVRLGESFTEAAQRELREETNLSGIAELLHMVHIRVYEETTNSLLEDKVMGICLINNPIGVLNANNEGIFSWLTASDLSTSNRLPETSLVLDILQGRTIGYEHTFTTTTY